MAKTVSAVVRLIDQFTKPLKKCSEQTRKFEGDMTRLSKKMSNVGNSFYDIGQNMTQAITLPLAAVGGAALQFSAQSDSAMSQFAAATGTATSAMGEYEEMINNVYQKNFGESINEVADSMALVKRNIEEIDDSSLESVTQSAFALRDTFGMEIAESTRAVDTLMKNFGVSSEEAFNLITQGAQNGLDFSGELIDSLNEYSVHFKNIGLDAEDMFSIMINGAEDGAFNLDKIGDSIKEFGIRAIDMSKASAVGFEALGMSQSEMAQKLAAGGDTASKAFDDIIQGLNKIEDPVQQNAAGVALFGTMWEDLSADVILSMSTTSDAIDMTKNSMEELAKVKYDTLTGALGGLWRTIQTDVLQPIGQMLIPYVEKAIDKVGELVDWWNSLGSATQQNIVKFAMIAGVAAPALMIFGKLIKMGSNLVFVFGKVPRIFETAKTAFTGLKTSGGLLSGVLGKIGGFAKTIPTAFKALTTVLTGPVGIAVAALVAGAITIYQNWDKIAPMIKRIADRFAEFWNNVQPQLQPFIDLLGQVASFLTDVFQAAFAFAFDSIGTYITTFIDGATETLDGFLVLLEGLIEFLTGVFTGNWSKAWNGLKDIVAGAFQALVGLVKTPMNAVIGVVNKAIDGINSINISIPDGVPFVGGTTLGFNIPKIPALAVGTDNWQGGLAQVHEKGGEIIDLPSGSRVYPHDESVRMARQEGKRAININIPKLADTLVVRDERDIENIAQKVAEHIVRRVEMTSYNMT